MVLVLFYFVVCVSNCWLVYLVSLFDCVVCLYYMCAFVYERLDRLVGLEMGLCSMSACKCKSWLVCYTFGCYKIKLTPVISD